MKYLLFFAALIATANALNCECSGQTCEAKPCTVEAGSCYSIEREISTEKDKPLKAIIRGCQDDKVEPNVCKQGFVFMSSDQDFYLGSNVTCCKDKDLCNQNLITNISKTIPTDNLVCPSCFALDKKECDGKQMKCNNLQKKCFNITGTITQGTAKAKDFVARGCAIENNIFTKNTTFTFNDASYKLVDVQLQEAKNGASQISSCLTFAILLPSVLWFLLDRSF
ncbi:phospholipase A2 inhibitor and Ly6/PLAUR domain-containing protein [Protobothrops mucrosquamatus]|uniref:phospholipase A2 inhibitor and Ly6/PLAUR domain-containing protein n=1 Tax=Protobothrops mucrosquamatus TaxID=103944 RepID=UPI0007757885|nr:phospholipase A2 inhibitor and Ly6/PLAUR domain-containing protein [Protobothrops mucrosquamatus]